MHAKVNATSSMPRRKPNRLIEYDYSQNGAYYITICTRNKECLFGNIVDDGEMKMNQYGQIAHDSWAMLPVRFTNVELDVFVVMPNHIHGIIILDNNSVDISQRARVNRAPIIGNIIGAYKSLVANACLNIYKSNNETMGKLWQRNFYDHVIRNEKSLGEIREYIINNPRQWTNDELFKGNYIEN